MNVGENEKGEIEWKKEEKMYHHEKKSINGRSLILQSVIEFFLIWIEKYTWIWHCHCSRELI